MEDDILARCFTLGIGVVAIGLGVLHDWIWRRRLRKWHRTTGTVVEVIDGDGKCPVIEYYCDGAMKKFTSNYAKWFIELGDEVEVLYDPQTDKAEHLDTRNRWLFTLFPIFVGIGFISFAIAPDTTFG